MSEDLKAAKDEVLARIAVHRMIAHNSYDLEEFFDCAVCGVLEARLRRINHKLGEGKSS